MSTQLKTNALIVDNDSPPFLKDMMDREETHVSISATPPTVDLSLTTTFAPVQEKPIKKTFRTAASTKGAVDSTASKQWASRPDDEKFMDLTSLRNAVYNRFSNSRTTNLNTTELHINDNMQLVLPERETPFDLTNWTYNQLCGLANAPVEYLKKLPVNIASDCLRYGLSNRNDEVIKALINIDSHSLRAINSATYGRIWDVQVIDQVMKIAGNGVNETCWKVPGTIDWSTSNGTTTEYNPYVDVTNETTTLYASDRDVFIFLVDDTHPIEIGKLANGEPDLMFRGFYVTNSETGAGAFELSCMMMRGVCANRNIWGVEGKQSIMLKHYKHAPDKFLQKALPMLAQYAVSPVAGVIDKVRAAKALIVARTDEDRDTFLTGKLGLGKGVSEAVQLRCVNEEHKPMESLWDAVQGITAYARTIRHQDTRVDLEIKAGKLMDKVTH